MAYYENIVLYCTKYENKWKNLLKIINQKRKYCKISAQQVKIILLTEIQNGNKIKLYFPHVNTPTL